jgi:3',5'-cyclic AMP phosphodiesterase CpdA
VIQAMLKAGEPDFVIHTGDLVADGSDSAQWPVFFSIERELLRKTAFSPSLGNHERNNPQYYEFFDVRTPYYSFDWANAHIVVLNSDLGKSRKADFAFVVFHHPPFSAVKRRQGEDREVSQAVPVMEKFKIGAVFSGHDHNYQHHLKGGVHYVVTGGGGAPLYPVDAPLAGITRKVESTEHYAGVRVNGKAARIQAFALDGRVIDTIELAARAEAR